MYTGAQRATAASRCDLRLLWAGAHSYSACCCVFPSQSRCASFRFGGVAGPLLPPRARRAGRRADTAARQGAREGAGTHWTEARGDRARDRGESSHETSVGGSRGSHTRVCVRSSSSSRGRQLDNKQQHPLTPLAFATSKGHLGRSPLSLDLILSHRTQLAQPQLKATFATLLHQHACSCGQHCRANL